MPSLERTLTVHDIESQAALELPDRELMALVTVVIAGNPVSIDANVCAQVITNDSTLTCRA
ncbi:MAG TPA: hypothetical protein VEK39_10070 [Solirubrobacterales bacterium]|nr:hypothetical protein [Solirubrobacterales bacterium]